MPSLALETLHPSLWRAQQLARARGAVQPSGHLVLDAELPGGGWPHQALSELLLAQPGIGELRLLAPALRSLARAGRPLALFGPPLPPHAPAWAALGLPPERLLLVQAPPDRGLPPLLWALEQGLRSGRLGAVLAWVPAGLRPQPLRRLQLAAHCHDGPAFLLRDAADALRPSAAPLRLKLAPAGADHLKLTLLKRRGPALAQPLLLELAPVVLPSVARRRGEPLLLPPLPQSVAAAAVASSATA